jgi:hypothetical protein
VLARRTAHLVKSLIFLRFALHKSHKIHYQKSMLRCTLAFSRGYVLGDDIDDFRVMLHRSNSTFRALRDLL